MKIDDVLKAHKLCLTPGEALDDPVCCDCCPYQQYGDACARHLIADTIEVLEEYKSLDEYEIYRKVQREFLLEDARNFIADELANVRDCDPEDITDEELDRFDYDGLVKEYERREDCNVAFNDTWSDIAHEEVNDYVTDLEWDER